MAAREAAAALSGRFGLGGDDPRRPTFLPAFVQGWITQAQAVVPLSCPSLGHGSRQAQHKGHDKRVAQRIHTSPPGQAAFRDQSRFRAKAVGGSYLWVTQSAQTACVRANNRLN